MSEKRDDSVGYGKPPTHSRFRKGKSGNPKGRKKGDRNFDTDLAEVLATGMTITENGRKKKVSAQKAALLRLREKALLGDGRALDRMLALAQQRSEDKAAQSAERGLSKEARVGHGPLQLITPLGVLPARLSQPSETAHPQTGWIFRRQRGRSIARGLPGLRWVPAIRFWIS